MNLLKKLGKLRRNVEINFSCVNKKKQNSISDELLYREITFKVIFLNTQRNNMIFLAELNCLG